jgi:hypothetical protein
MAQSSGPVPAKKLKVDVCLAQKEIFLCLLLNSAEIPSLDFCGVRALRAGVPYIVRLAAKKNALGNFFCPGFERFRIFPLQGGQQMLVMIPEPQLARLREYRTDTLAFLIGNRADST